MIRSFIVVLFSMLISLKCLKCVGLKGVIRVRIVSLIDCLNIFKVVELLFILFLLKLLIGYFIFLYCGTFLLSSKRNRVTMLKAFSFFWIQFASCWCILFAETAFYLRYLGNFWIFPCSFKQSTLKNYVVIIIRLLMKIISWDLPPIYPVWKIVSNRLTHILR